MNLSSSPCCPPGSWPQALLQTEDGLNQDDVKFVPRGSVIELPATSARPTSTLPLYVVTPTGTPSSQPPKGLLLVLQDIFSVRVFHPDARSGDRLAHLCDYWSDTLDCAVAMPSLFRDIPVDVALQAAKEEDRQTAKVDWLKQQTYDKVGPDVVASVAHLRQEFGPDLPIAAVGFCYGAWLFSKASSSATKSAPSVLFSCAVGCHPSTQNETLQGGDEVAMIQGLQCPTLFICASNDSAIYRETDGVGRQALEATGGGVEVFPEMVHGWIARGDVSQTNVLKDMERAVESATKFLRMHMGTKGHVST